MVFKSQKAFALALMCMTSLSTLQAGGDDGNPDSSKSVTQSQKRIFQINEHLVIGGPCQYSNFAMQLNNSPDLRVGYTVALSASQEEIQKLAKEGGFEVQKVWGNYQLEDFNLENSPRCIFYLKAQQN